MRRTYAIGTPLIILLGIGTYWWATTESRAVDFFAEALAVENISIESEVRTDLAVAYARALTERNPIMSLAGTDPQKFTDAVAQLSLTREALAARQSDTEMSTYVRSALYPIEFLETLPDLETKRRAFIASGTLNDWTTYNAALIKSSDAYERALSDFKQAFTAVVPKDAPEYATINSRISRTDMLTAIESLALSHAKIQHEIERRSHCVSGRIYYCNQSDISLPVTLTPASIEISPEDHAIVQNILKLTEASNPIFEMSKGACTANLPGAGIFSLDDERGQLIPLYLGDIRLIESSRYVDIPFYAYFNKRGVPYVPSPPFTHYACPEFAEEFSQLLGKRALPNPQTPEDFLTVRNNSAESDQVLSYLAYLEESIMNADKNGAPGAFDAASLFYVRSGFLATFLTFNKSFGGGASLFTQPPLPREEQPFVYYSQLVDTPNSTNQVRAGIHAFEAVHHTSQ